jgi:hypothetical protein
VVILPVLFCTLIERFVVPVQAFFDQSISWPVAVAGGGTVVALLENLAEKTPWVIVLVVPSGVSTSPEKVPETPVESILDMVTENLSIFDGTLSYSTAPFTK